MRHILPISEMIVLLLLTVLGSFYSVLSKDILKTRAYNIVHFIHINYFLKMRLGVDSFSQANCREIKKYNLTVSFAMIIIIMSGREI